MNQAFSPNRKSEPPAEAAQGGSRKLILDTAARLFRDEGFASVSLRDIAAECGMRAASLYHHFASKDEIVSEVLRIGVQRVHEEVRRAVIALPPDVDTRTLLHTAMRAHLKTLLELHDYSSANVRIFGQVPAQVREAHIATRDAYERFWTLLFKRCRFAGRRDLHLARLFLINAANGSLEWFRRDRASVDDLSYELTEIFLDGLNGSAPPARKKRSRGKSPAAPR